MDEQQANVGRLWVDKAVVPCEASVVLPKLGPAVAESHVVAIVQRVRADEADCSTRPWMCS